MTSEPDSERREAFYIPLNLGTATQYDQSIFPLLKLKDKNTLDQVDIVLEATLSEIFKIRQMAADTRHFRDLIADTKSSYDKLVLKREKLEKQQKSFNPVKLFSTYRSSRLLAEAGKKLFQNTKTTSERMRRQLLSVNSTNVERVQYDDLPRNTRIRGLAIPLDSPLDESTNTILTEAASFIASQLDLLSEGDPFADDYEVEDAEGSVGGEGSSTAESTSEGGSRLSGASSSTSSSGQGSGNNYYIFNNSYVASRSAITTPTLNHGGSNNHGSARH
ncbi:hypothetical protein M405DRAFT_934028 [Rhizopogon salebrosus TDB-379]|nr:hypothetical protein M405DRAFT_934028 [Rhizopogon salebrosus TDB-379]